jgi:hypothetical protein
MTDYYAAHEALHFDLNSSIEVVTMDGVKAVDRF